MPSLEITTMVGCPLMCSYCPQDKLKASYGDAEKYMSLENFATILSKVPLHVQVDFSGMSEPWANPAATDMLELALSCGYHVVVYTTLYGMTPDDARRVVALMVDHRDQVKEVCLHLPDANGNMHGYKPSAEYDEVLSIIVAASKQLRSFRAMTMDGRSRVHPSVKMAATNARWEGLDRAGNVDEAIVVPHVRHSGPVSCSFTPFYDHNVVLPNGDVVLCCMDYSTKHRVGNLLKDSYYAIFESTGMGHLRAENVKLGEADTICKSCNRATAYRQRAGDNQFWDAVR